MYLAFTIASLSQDKLPSSQKKQRLADFIVRKTNRELLFTHLHSTFHSQPCPEHLPACYLSQVFKVAV